MTRRLSNAVVNMLVVNIVTVSNLSFIHSMVVCFWLEVGNGRHKKTRGNHRLTMGPDFGHKIVNENIQNLINPNDLN